MDMPPPIFKKSNPSTIHKIFNKNIFLINVNFTIKIYKNNIKIYNNKK